VGTSGDAARGYGKGTILHLVVRFPCTPAGAVRSRNFTITRARGPAQRVTGMTEAGRAYLIVTR